MSIFPLSKKVSRLTSKKRAKRNKKKVIPQCKKNLNKSMAVLRKVKKRWKRLSKWKKKMKRFKKTSKKMRNKKKLKTRNKERKNNPRKTLTWQKNNLKNKKRNNSQCLR
jgi:hypothetical protein